MSKFCPKCGAENTDDATFCGNCGNSLTENTTPSYTTQNNNTMSGSTTIAKREVIISIILSLVTCGIYGIYWFIVLTDDANKACNEDGTSGGLAFLFTLITCGIYGLYWYYQMGQKLHRAGQIHNQNIADNSILYLILGLFGFGIINYAIIQSDLNKIAQQQ